MTFEWVTDSTGERMWMQRIHKGRYVGKPFKPHTIENLVHVPLRDDDVILCSYPKSGTHWMYENLRCLVTEEIQNDNVQKEVGMIEMKEHGHFDSHPSPRILNTHVAFDDMPSDLVKGKGKVVLIYRNPKDIAVSFFHHHSKIASYKYSGVFSNYIKRFIEGKVGFDGCFDYWNMWEEGLANNPQIQRLLVRYEDLHSDPIGQRRRLASFLGKECDDQFLQDVVKATSFDEVVAKKGADALKTESGDLIMYRKGQVGDWKNHFTVAESEWFDGMVEKHMSGSKLFKFKYSI